jgi:type IV secretion system protein VirB10
VSHTVSNPYEHDPVEPTAADAPANPYLQSRPAAPPPDLDAAAPMLRNDEQQRINRKALVFLGGILLLLMLLAILVLRGSKGASTAEKPAEEQVSIPTLADSTPPLPHGSASGSDPAVEPIQLQGTSDQALSPPLPPLPAPAPEASAYPSAAPGSAAPVVRPPTLLERRMGAEAGAGDPMANPQTAVYAQTLAMAQAAMAQQSGTGTANAAADTTATDPARRPTSARYLRHADALLVRGTVLRCILETRVISEADGFTSCILTEPVYSINGRNLLLARGSKVYGTYRARPKGNRIEVVWDRVTTPDGIDVAMSSPGIDPLGSAGYPGAVDAHWASRISSALLVSLLSDVFKYEAAKHGPSTSSISNGVVVVSPFESNTADTLDRLANQAADAGMSRPPTVTINQGTLVSVYVAKDVDFTDVLGR